MREVLTKSEKGAIHNVSKEKESEDASRNLKGVAGQSLSAGGRGGPAEHGGTEGESVTLREEVSSGGIQATEESGRTGTVLPEKGEDGKRTRSESGGRPDGMEQGNPPGNIGVGQRLEEISRPTGTPAKDAVLNEAELGFNAGAAARFDANLDAIYVLKQLDKENRQATPDEQAVLAKFSGFGDSAFNEAFNKYSREASWKRRGEQLKSITALEEYEAIEKSRLNAFYTTPEIIRMMWQGLKKMGADDIAHPRILEPSAGSGRFLGFQPTDMAARSERTAVELDKLTGRVLKQLYPETLPALAELLKVQERRSLRSQRADLAKKHSVVIAPTSPKVAIWSRDQGRADIRGVDTPSISRRRQLRITPRTPRLR